MNTCQTCGQPLNHGGQKHGPRARFCTICDVAHSLAGLRYNPRTRRMEPKEPPKPGRREKALRMSRRGLGVTVIAARLGVSRETARAWLSEARRVRK